KYLRDGLYISIEEVKNDKPCCSGDGPFPAALKQHPQYHKYVSKVDKRCSDHRRNRNPERLNPKECNRRKKGHTYYRLDFLVVHFLYRLCPSYLFRNQPAL